MTLLALTLMAALPLLPCDLGNQSPLVTSARLTPGDGWTGTTRAETVPGPHDDATVIAHWTRMPDQIFWRGSADEIELGLLAYHRSMIDSVRVAVDGGPWVAIDQLTRSAQTGHYGYNVKLVKELFDTGWHEVRAVCTPHGGADGGGVERVLSWDFYNGSGERPWVDFDARWVDAVNGSDTASGTPAAPFASVQRAIESFHQGSLGFEGAVVYLMGGAGTSLGIGGATLVTDNQIPITITAATGHEPILKPRINVDYLPIRKLTIENLDIDISADKVFRAGTAPFVPQLHFKDCHFQGYTRPRNLAVSGVVHSLFEPAEYGGYENVRAADSTFFDIDGSPTSGMAWLRGVRVEEVRYDGLFGVRCAIDCFVRDVAEGDGGGGATGWMPYLPSFGLLENVLLDGTRLIDIEQHSGQLVFDDTDGVAMVNSILEGGDGSSINSFNLGQPQMGFGPNDHKHTLVINCSFPYSQWFINYLPPPFGLTDAFPASIATGVIAKSFYDDNNFGNPSTPIVSGLKLDLDYIHINNGPRPGWSNWTMDSVSATFVAAPASDFHVLQSSAGWGRVAPSDQWHRFDAAANRRGVTVDFTAVGALTGENE